MNSRRVREEDGLSGILKIITCLCCVVIPVIGACGNEYYDLYAGSPNGAGPVAVIGADTGSICNSWCGTDKQWVMFFAAPASIGMQDDIPNVGLYEFSSVNSNEVFKIRMIGSADITVVDLESIIASNALLTVSRDTGGCHSFEYDKQSGTAIMDCVDEYNENGVFTFTHVATGLAKEIDTFIAESKISVDASEVSNMFVVPAANGNTLAATSSETPTIAADLSESKTAVPETVSQGRRQSQSQENTLLDAIPVSSNEDQEQKVETNDHTKTIKTISVAEPAYTSWSDPGLVLANINSLPEPFTVILLGLGGLTLFSQVRQRIGRIKSTLKSVLF